MVGLSDGARAIAWEKTMGKKFRNIEAVNTVTRIRITICNKTGSLATLRPWRGQSIRIGPQYSFSIFIFLEMQNLQ